MSYVANEFIDKFAAMLEENEPACSEKFASRTVEFILMLSMHEELSHTLGQIKATIASILTGETELDNIQQKHGQTANQYVAKQLRALKYQPH